ncbi:MAG: GNAT family N-acetyltransferase [Bradyrhizobium sp.]|uniref:GNAT family N-acetyltransferase n=1 Tax=Bradyrhizobium sp. TaxID=376 RepID=UPI0025C72421|nr:GNAT family N-acetyltransferase [Bradyrhizobium sp.]MBI5261314.1 GNAT family N-acetyltransferase [Bradyrhizobium sp.]
MYRIRAVDGGDEEIAETLSDLHRLTFFDSAPIPDFESGCWWFACCASQPIGFAGLVPSTHVPNSGYFCRVGILRPHWGRGLQLRLTRALEAQARRNGWDSVVSDTTDNPVSANNFIRAGYRLYQPQFPWGWANTLYWSRQMKAR